VKPAHLPLDELLARAGSTPFYAIDIAAVRDRIAGLRALLPADLQLCYAVKANPLPALLRAIAQSLDGADVSSAGELVRALDAGFRADSLGFTGPGKRDDELRQAILAGARICAESTGEIGRIAALSEQLGQAARVALRANPDFTVDTSRVRMSGDSFFGMDSALLPAAIAQLRHAGLEFAGLHYYCASRMLDAATVRALHAHCAEEALRICDAADLALPWLNLGGGFGVPVAKDESPLDMASVGDHLRALSDMLKRACPGIVLALEPGRYLVAEAGHYICRVIDRKTTRGRTWLIVDGGAHQHLHATLQPDRSEPAAFPMTLHPSVPGEREIVSIAGPLCAPFDIFARDIELPRASPGDLLVVHCSGAYGASASPLHFLGHPSPAEIVF
jgi:diaminopimelate decarboxylase